MNQPKNYIVLFAELCDHILVVAMTHLRHCYNLTLFACLSDGHKVVGVCRVQVGARLVYMYVLLYATVLCVLDYHGGDVVLLLNL